MLRNLARLSLLIALLIIAIPLAQAQSDSDGDGFNDDEDAFPNNPNAWTDDDGDGYADQPGENISDDCPNTYGTSRIHMLGCIDTDGDWVPDMLDDDIDGDGITNDLELAASNALKKYDIFNPNDVPPDSDYDTIPDVLDDDDDNDGWPDSVELERGSDQFNYSITPFNLYGRSTGFFFVSGHGFTSEYSDEGIEISLSWMLSALQSELILVIALVPITLIIWFYRNEKFKKFDAALGDVKSLSELKDIENEINEAMRDRKILTSHGLILRNTIERMEDELDSSWFEKFGVTDSEE